MHRNAFAYIRGGAGWIRSPVVEGTLPNVPTEETTGALQDDTDGATAADEMQILSSTALLDRTHPIWTPRLASQPVMGSSTPAGDQQDVDMETRFWAGLWEKEAEEFEPDFSPDLLFGG